MKILITCLFLTLGLGTAALAQDDQNAEGRSKDCNDPNGNCHKNEPDRTWTRKPQHQVVKEADKLTGTATDKNTDGDKGKTGTAK
ncbi:MAG: hypothetical protein AB7N80_05830 [Bdellovibrionales bacterium]